MLLNENLQLLFLHTTQQASSLRCSTLSSIGPQHWFLQHQLELVLAASASLTRFFNCSPPIQLQLVFADSTSTATLQFQLSTGTLIHNQRRMFQTLKFDYTNNIKLTQYYFVYSL